MNPHYSSGKIQVGPIPRSKQRNTVIKYGKESKLTIGHLHMSGMHIRAVNVELGLTENNDGMESTVKFMMFNQQEIFSSSPGLFFKAGDSGAFVFMMNDSEGKDLHCIGMAIGSTSYNSCIMTPIDAVLEKLQLPANLKSFQVPVYSGTSAVPQQSQDSMQQTTTSQGQDQMQLILAAMNRMEVSIKSEMKSEIGSVKSELDSMKSELGSMKSELGTIKSEMGSIGNSVKTIENKCKSEIAVVTGNIQSMNQDMTSIKAVHDDSTNNARQQATNASDSDSDL